jgi:L-threonylcarbamoyladenylate synthase
VLSLRCSPCGALPVDPCIYWTPQIFNRLHENNGITNPLPSLYIPLTHLGIHYPDAVHILNGTSAAKAAAELLASGALVIVPTETVYGLAAHAEDESAVNRVFTTKNRPNDHPLIVHIANPECLDYWAVNIPDYARDLATALWPGPMTLVLPRNSPARDFITGNQETVALRIPQHPVALEIIKELGEVTGNPCVGIAAPSANRFGKVSPTTLDHAQQELAEYLNDIDAGVDGGPCNIGIESTIIDCTGKLPIILRRGAITEHDIESIVALSESNHSMVRAPGMLASHYAPSATVMVVLTASEIEPGASHAFLIAPSEVDTPPGVTRIASPRDAHEYARVLYSALREADELHADVIYVVPPEGSGIAAAVRDRINRAAHQ